AHSHTRARRGAGREHRRAFSDYHRAHGRRGWRGKQLGPAQAGVRDRQPRRRLLLRYAVHRGRANADGAQAHPARLGRHLAAHDREAPTDVRSQAAARAGDGRGLGL
ncbi:MAG: SSU ribosomal protein S6p, partial [uncultured Rubrobacteraceae bacterium]